MPVNLVQQAPREPLQAPAAGWLATIAEHIFTTGLNDLSLRQLAAIAGTSHRMLIYYFGSRDGVLAAVLRTARQKEAERLVREADSRRQAMQDAWDYYCQPERQLEMRIFFYLAGQGAAAPGTQPEFVDAVVSTWVEALTTLGVQEGLPSEQATDDARLLTAAARGLFLDRLLTGESTAVDRAFARLLDAVLGTT